MLEAGCIPPPHVPSLSSPEDVSHFEAFDDEVTDMAAAPAAASESEEKAAKRIMQRLSDEFDGQQQDATPARA